MNPELKALMQQIQQFGETHDKARTNKMERMRNVAPETGALLSLMVGATRARRVLEVGTSNGYSTLWLADAARSVGGTVTTLEFLPEKAELARENFRRAGFEDLITLHLGDAGDHLRSQGADSFDLIFLDSDRTEYPAWWADIERVLAPGGLIIVDNAISHAAELQPFFDAVDATPGCDRLVLPLPKGACLIHKRLA